VKEAGLIICRKFDGLGSLPLFEKARNRKIPGFSIHLCAVSASRLVANPHAPHMPVPAVPESPGAPVAGRFVVIDRSGVIAGPVTVIGSLTGSVTVIRGRIELSRCRGIEACCETGSSHGSLDGGWCVWNYWT